MALHASRPAFLIAAGLACVATVLASILAWRTRGVYQKQQPAGDPEQSLLLGADVGADGRALSLPPSAQHGLLPVSFGGGQQGSTA